MAGHIRRRDRAQRKVSPASSPREVLYDMHAGRSVGGITVHHLRLLVAEFMPAVIGHRLLVAQPGTCTRQASISGLVLYCK